MDLGELLVDAFSRVRDGAHEAAEGLSAEQLAHRPGPGEKGNPIGWLVWHLARVQDDHIADLAGLEQVWRAQGWQGRLGLPFPPEDTGFGHSGEQVAQARFDGPAALLGYVDAVHEQTAGFVAGVTPEQLGRVVDERWDPVVTLGVRLVSIINDDQQHVGQAAYVRGLLGA